MIIIVCLDDKNGLSFNGRRLSRDRAVCEDIIKSANGTSIWMQEYSVPLFSDAKNIKISPDFLRKAGVGEFCFCEGEEVKSFLEKAEKIIVYRWNRVYPSDIKLSFPACELQKTSVFSGNSHKKITKEEYSL